MGQTFSTPPPPTQDTFDHEFPIRYAGYNAVGAPIDDQGQPYKPCCVCPETKKARDECMLQHGSEVECQTFILRHQACLRSYGFQIPKPTTTPPTSSN